MPALQGDEAKAYLCNNRTLMLHYRKP
jgi:hypothetical protein